MVGWNASALFVSSGASFFYSSKGHAVADLREYRPHFSLWTNSCTVTQCQMKCCFLHYQITMRTSGEMWSSFSYFLLELCSSTRKGSIETCAVCLLLLNFGRITTTKECFWLPRDFGSCIIQGAMQWPTSGGGLCCTFWTDTISDVLFN